MSHYAQPIFTLNARGFLMLEVMRDHFGLSPEHMHGAIRGMHADLLTILDSKNVPYASLKSGLVPSMSRNEAGFLFDSRDIESDWYGYDVADVVLPLIDKRGTRSVLCGDLIGRNQHLIYDVLNESLVLKRSLDFVHGTCLCCVYVNNLTDAALARMDDALGAYPPYVGFIPGTYDSRARTYLSTCLVNAYLVAKNKVLMGHEDDVPNDENRNMLAYPFEAHGFEVLSLQSMYFHQFLGYKIERAVVRGFEVDTEMALNAISKQPLDLNECDVRVDEAKRAYLQSEKLGKLKKAGLERLSAKELARLIKAKIAASYIYNMTYLEEHEVAKFNLIVEVPHPRGGHPTRVLAALKYLPEEKVLSVITLS